jgi:hypothetical protein
MRPDGDAAPCSDEIHTVPVSALVASGSPRLSGESRDHIELLFSLDIELPPILVHRQTMRVIDGMHRLRVALLRGEKKIKVRFFDGGDNEAFIVAVQSNVRHGLPLSLADRTAAAERIVTACPQLSNRSIASSTGLSPKTIAAIRKRTNGDHPQLNARVGQDGKVRPVDSSVGRQLAAQLLQQNPQLPLRELAEASGVSLGTAHDVRERCRTGRDPVPSRCRRRGGRKKHDDSPTDDSPTRARARSVGPHVLRPVGPEHVPTLDKLKKDPSLRFSDAGRRLLRMLDAQSLDAEQWNSLIATVPPHRADAVAQLALELAESWQVFAEQLGERAAKTGEADMSTSPLRLLMAVSGSKPRLVRDRERKRRSDLST